MQEMTMDEVNEISAAGPGAAVALAVSSAWVGAVAGVAFGSIVPGAGNVIGGAFGFAFGAVVGTAAAIATYNPN